MATDERQIYDQELAAKKLRQTTFLRFMVKKKKVKLTKTFK